MAGRMDGRVALVTGGGGGIGEATGRVFAEEGAAVVLVDADAEAAWSAEIRTRLDRVDAGTATTIPWSEARRRIHAAARRDPRA